MTDATRANVRSPLVQTLSHGSLAWLCAIVLLFGVISERLAQRRVAENAAPYQERVRKAVAFVPYHFDGWLGTDVPVPQGAVILLKPNVIVSRRFLNMSSGGAVTLLFVDCKDARDILGHFPPVCYPAQGWTLSSSSRHDWMVRDRPIHGMTYEFVTPGTPAETIIVDNFMVLPNGTTGRDMDAVGTLAQDPNQKYLGVAQMQLIYGAGFSEADREQVFHEFAAMLSPTLNVILHPERNYE